MKWEGACQEGAAFHPCAPQLLRLLACAPGRHNARANPPGRVGIVAEATGLFGAGLFTKVGGLFPLESNP